MGEINMKKAIVLSDVVAVISPRPGHLRGEVEIELPRPRTEEMEKLPDFLEYVDVLTHLLREKTSDGTSN